MNTEALAELYDRLTPSERLPLILAAHDRGDGAEADRLIRSAPRTRLWLPDYHGLCEGLVLASVFHAIEQLRRGLLYWQTQGALGQWSEVCPSAEDETRGDRLWGLIRLMACRMGIEADAWRPLLAEGNIDPEVWLRDLPGYDEVRRTEEACRTLAGPPEEAAALFQRYYPEDAETPTVEQSAAALREFIDQRVKRWD